MHGAATFLDAPKNWASYGIKFNRPRNLLIISMNLCFLGCAKQGFGEKSFLFSLLSSRPTWQPEGPVEKKIREAGEWVINTTEGDSSSSGYNTSYD